MRKAWTTAAARCLQMPWHFLFPTRSQFNQVMKMTECKVKLVSPNAVLFVLKMLQIFIRSYIWRNLFDVFSCRTVFLFSLSHYQTSSEDIHYYMYYQLKKSASSSIMKDKYIDFLCRNEFKIVGSWVWLATIIIRHTASSRQNPLRVYMEETGVVKKQQQHTFSAHILKIVRNDVQMILFFEIHSKNICFITVNT